MLLHIRWVVGGFIHVSSQYIFSLWSVMPSRKIATLQLVLVAYINYFSRNGSDLMWLIQQVFITTPQSLLC